jgi:hypothetical protein
MCHLLEVSMAIRCKISLTKLLRMAIALLEIPVSGWTVLRMAIALLEIPASGWTLFEDIIDKEIEDGHCFVGETSIGMDLLKH